MTFYSKPNSNVSRNTEMELPSSPAIEILRIEVFQNNLTQLLSFPAVIIKKKLSKKIRDCVLQNNEKIDVQDVNSI